jgi:hypothetical protein
MLRFRDKRGADGAQINQLHPVVPEPKIEEHRRKPCQGVSQNGALRTKAAVTLP